MQCLLLKEIVFFFLFQILREVKYLAGLTHKHVVRYHGAWLEYQSETFTQLSVKNGGLPAISYEDAKENSLPHR